MTYKPSYQEELANALITRDLVVNGSISAEGSSSTNLLGAVQVRYVRPAGSNANDGTTPATAWATFQFAITQLITNAQNGAQVLDITGINEQLPSDFMLPQLFNNTPFILWAPGLFGIAGALTIHADPSLSLSVPPANIVGVTQDPDNGQDTIVTNLVLVPGALVGKIVFQFGFPSGVVKSNTATDILTTTSGLSALFTIELYDAGATLTTDGTPFTPTITVRDSASAILIEGVNLLAPQAADALSVVSLLDNLLFLAGELNGLTSANTPGGISILNSYLSAGGNNNVGLASPGSLSGCFIDAMNFGGIESFVTGEGISVTSCGIYGCGPLFRPNANFSVGQGFCSLCEILNPTSNAFDLRGQGVFTISSTTMDGCPSACVVADGQMNIHMNDVPAGAGNLDFGVSAAGGTEVETDSTVALTGASGDTSIGHAGVFTWAAITAAANNRISDFGANGDGSTIRRAP